MVLCQTWSWRCRSPLLLSHYRGTGMNKWAVSGQYVWVDSQLVGLGSTLRKFDNFPNKNQPQLPTEWDVSQSPSRSVSQTHKCSSGYLKTRSTTPNGQIRKLHTNWWQSLTTKRTLPLNLRTLWPSSGGCYCTGHQAECFIFEAAQTPTALLFFLKRGPNLFGVRMLNQKVCFPRIPCSYGNYVSHSGKWEITWMSAGCVCEGASW